MSVHERVEGNQESLADTCHRLVMWYRENRRHMPWRETTDPYAIWLSETMLQQTRVETVIPYYHAFMKEFPTATHLAEAEEETVLKQWQGLGYYSRARNLHLAAKVLVAEHGGEIPNDVAAFAALPGVGPYTLGAVMSIAFHRPVPAVDGNVLRVMSRVLGLRNAIETREVRAAITAHVSACLLNEEPADVTQGLMEIGATVCTPKNASCLVCPLQTACVAYRDGIVHELPVRAKKKARRHVQVSALWLDVGTHVLMQQREDSGLLAGMWQLPAIEQAVEPKVEQGVEQKVEQALEPALEPLGKPSTPKAEEPFSALVQRAPWLAIDSKPRRAPELTALAPIAHEKHTFTHIEWKVQVYRPVRDIPFTYEEVQGYLDADGESSWVFMNKTDLSRLPLPRVYEKLLERLLGPQNDLLEGVEYDGVHTG